jgi:hypothetical protein
MIWDELGLSIRHGLKDEISTYKPGYKIGGGHQTRRNPSGKVVKLY